MLFAELAEVAFNFIPTIAAGRKAQCLSCLRDIPLRSEQHHHRVVHSYEEREVALPVIGQNAVA